MQRHGLRDWNGNARRSARCLFLMMAIACGTGEAFAQKVARTPLPDYTGRRVTVAEIPDRYPSILKKIEDVEKATGASFYLVVVRSSGRGDNATRSYVDDLFRAWSKSAAANGSKFDPDRSVLIVVAVENRQIATHAGTALRRIHGLDSATIRTELVEPHFIPLAKEQKYEEAMAALLDGFQAKMTGAEPNLPGTAVHHDRGIVDSLPETVTPTTSKASTKAAASQPAGRQIVWALLASLLAVAAIIFGLLWLGRRRVSDSVTKQLKGVKGQAVEAMDRLDALKERHKLLPASAPGFDRPMTGQTLEHYNAVKAKLDSLWDRWLQVMDKIEKAQKLIGAGGGLSLGNQKSRQAEEILSKEVKFPEIEAEAQECSAELDRLEKSHADVQQALKDFAESRKQLQAQVESVGKAGLPTAPYQPNLGAIDQLKAQAETLVAPDPIGSEGIVQQAKAQVDEQVGRARDVLALLTQSKAIERALKEVEGAASVQRSKGFKLQEEGGNPDPLIVEGVRRQGLGFAALQAGEPANARAELAEADAQAKKAQQILDAVTQAKAFCRREGSARDRETARLRDAFGEARNYRDLLEREFAPASWDGVARNLDQARALLDTFDRKSAEAAEEGSDSKQNYLLGAKLYEELGRQQQIVLRLMAGLGEQVNTLSAIRKEVQDLVHQLESADRKTGTLFDQNGDVVTAQAQGLFDSTRRAFSKAAEKLNDRRPDWPALRDALKQILEEYGIVEARMETDLTAYRSLIDEADQTKREADRVASFLAAHVEDRPAANRRLQSARSNLNGISGRNPDRDWPRLLQVVRDAASDVQAAERMAREDIRLAAQAESEIAEATATIQQANSVGGMGIVANTLDAEARVGQAQQLLRSQNYEQAIAQAEAAFQLARSAYNAATQQVFYQQMQYEAERRRHYASEMARASYRGPSPGSIAAASAAASILSRMAEAAGGHVSSGGGDWGSAQDSQGQADVSSSSDDGTSVSSWESESSQSNW